VAPPAAGAQLRFDLHELKTKFPYITMMPQTRFLTFLTSEAQRFPSFRLVMGARVEELLEEDGQVRGLRYRSLDGWHEVRALLVVGTDGRFSRLRKLAGFEPIASSPPMDVLWLRLSRTPDDPHGLMARFSRGLALIFLEREDHWQIGYIIGKGTYQQVHAAGLSALRQGIVETAPEFADRVAELQDWKQASILSVEANRLQRWYRPGLLLLGDAAHVMSPAGGNGINYAIMDAVAAANILTAPLQTGQVTVADLDRVQRRRELPTRIIQLIVNYMQDSLLKAALDPKGSFTFPSFLGWPLVRKLPPLIFGFGIRPEHVQTETQRRPNWSHVGTWIAGMVAIFVGIQLIRRLLRRS
jgi:2-polyprenyl-6-methoxyphenol hydroxylase-like FAD-dependent oxidoreductase